MRPNKTGSTSWGGALNQRANLFDRELSASLDAVRSLAACYVILHHVAMSHGIGWPFGFGFRFSQEAVICFFILSGFVIYANESERANNPLGYYLRRFRRIYPALFFSLLLSTLITSLNGNLFDLFSIGQLLGTILSLQDISSLKPGVIVDPYLGNGPLWSLSYEIAFYAGFPLVLSYWKASTFRRGHIIGCLCFLSYLSYCIFPNHFSLVGAYFIIWWCGAMAADVQVRCAGGYSNLAIACGWLVALLILAVFVSVRVGYAGAGVYPVLPLRHFLSALVILAMSFSFLRKYFIFVALWGQRIFSSVSSISYGLYVLHYPLLVQLKYAHGIIGFTAALVVLVLLAYFVERKLPAVLPAAPKS